MKKIILTVITLIPCLASQEIKSIDIELITATRQGNLEEVRRLLDEGANPNEGGGINYTALHKACLFDQTEIAIELIRRGADLNLMNKLGTTPLELARIGGSTRTLLAITEQREELILEAIPHYQRPMIRDLMQGFHTTLQDKEGKTFYIITSLTKLNRYYNQSAVIHIQYDALRTQEAALDTQWAALRTQRAALQNQRAALGTQEAALRTQEAALNTQGAALLTQWDALRTQLAALYTQLAALDTQYALLFTPKHIRNHHEAASKGIEAVRSGTHYVHQHIPALKAQLSFSSPDQGTKTETTIGALTASFLDEKRGLNIYQAAINDATPYIMTLTMATAWIQRVLQRALEGAT